MPIRDIKTKSEERNSMRPKKRIHIRQVLRKGGLMAAALTLLLTVTVIEQDFKIVLNEEPANLYPC